ncbi:MAG: N-formylglutamate amidohydrolase [Pseudomonadota bacterium]
MLDSEGQSSGIVVQAPRSAPVPLIVAIPHAGTLLPEAAARRLAVDRKLVRTLEDPWVDALASSVPDLGGWVVSTRWSRAVADVNRAADEFDPAQLRRPVPTDDAASTRWRPSAKARVGLGVVPTRVAGLTLYRPGLSSAEVDVRVALGHQPFHAALQDVIERQRQRFGSVLLVDLHSMPEAAQPSSGPPIDVAVGDRHAASADACWPRLVADHLRGKGLTVAHNRPYAGGHVTAAYGRPDHGVHALQLELRRRLYMDERRFTRHAGLVRLRTILHEMFQVLSVRTAGAPSSPLAIAGE